MSNMDLRRKVGYKERRADPAKRATPHGPERGYAAFLALGEERAGACEMDTVIGRARDRQCVLTLYLRPCKFQALLLLPEKSPGAVAAALGSLEEALGKDAFPRLLGLLLTDNGTEFSDHAAMERSALPGKGARCKVHCCDVRQSQQKAGCEPVRMSPGATPRGWRSHAPDPSGRPGAGAPGPHTARWAAGGPLRNRSANCENS